MAYKALTADITAGCSKIHIVGRGDYMPAQMYSELETKNAELRTKVEFMARAINNAYDFIPAGALGIKSDLKQAVNYPHQTTICYQCERPALVLNKNSRCITCVTENFEKTEAELELALEGKHPAQAEAAVEAMEKASAGKISVRFVDGSLAGKTISIPRGWATFTRRGSGRKPEEYMIRVEGGVLVGRLQKALKEKSDD